MIMGFSRIRERGCGFPRNAPGQFHYMGGGKKAAATTDSWSRRITDALSFYRLIQPKPDRTASTTPKRRVGGISRQF